MTWKDKRIKMDAVLKKSVISALKENGFKGTYPHLRKQNGNKIDIFGIQFSQWGTQFYIEIGTCALEGQTFLDGSFYPAKTIKYYQCKKRVRIGEQPFDFENENFEKIRDQAVACLKEAYIWWNATTP